MLLARRNTVAECVQPVAVACGFHPGRARSTASGVNCCSVVFAGPRRAAGRTIGAMLVRERTAADHDTVAAFLAANRSSRVARRGTLCRPLDHPALLAIDGTGSLAGVLTYIVDGTACEILTLHATRQWQGTGTALVTAVRRLAAAAGCGRLWLVTTNDNVDALRFYQRRGFHLTALRPDAITAARRSLKPEISLTGAYAIPLRDELELSMTL